MGLKKNLRRLKFRGPEFAVAFDPLQIEDLWSGAGMKLEQPFRYGSWYGRPGAHDFYQDVIISRPA
jgi:hypothetical protein